MTPRQVIERRIKVICGRMRCVRQDMATSLATVDSSPDSILAGAKLVNRLACLVTAMDELCGALQEIDDE